MISTIRSFILLFALVSAPVHAAKKSKKSKNPSKPEALKLEFAALRSFTNYGEGPTLDDFIELTYGIGVDQNPNPVGSTFIIGNPVFKKEEVPVMDGKVGDVDMSKSLGSLKSTCTIIGVTEETLESYLCHQYLCFGSDDCLYMQSAKNNAGISKTAFTNVDWSGIVTGGTGKFASVKSGQTYGEQTINPLAQDPSNRSKYFYSTLVVELYY